MEFCIDEWASGAYNVGKFEEKKYAQPYRDHMALVEHWTNLRPDKTVKLRENMFLRVMYVFNSTCTQLFTDVECMYDSKPVDVGAAEEQPATISSEAQRQMEDELDRRTFDTDSDDDNAFAVSVRNDLAT